MPSKLPGATSAEVEVEVRPYAEEDADSFEWQSEFQTSSS